jgi:amino acid transporter
VSGYVGLMAPNKQKRKASTFISTLTYWVVLGILGAAIVGSMVVVVDAGTSIVGVAGLIAALVLAAAALSYGLSMRSRKQAPSR